MGTRATTPEVIAVVAEEATTTLKSALTVHKLLSLRLPSALTVERWVISLKTAHLVMKVKNRSLRDSPNNMKATITTEDVVDTRVTITEKTTRPLEAAPTTEVEEAAEVAITKLLKAVSTRRATTKSRSLSSRLKHLSRIQKTSLWLRKRRSLKSPLKFKSQSQKSSSPRLSKLSPNQRLLRRRLLRNKKSRKKRQ